MVLVRHGQSEWNKENRFTGWTDIDLSEQGKQEAKQAGKTLKKVQFRCDLAYTSLLKRAVRTLWIILDEMDKMWIPVVKSWRLNERHYGGLTGLNKQDIINKYGMDQVRLWRRDYETTPPVLNDLELDEHNHPPLHPEKDSQTPESSNQRSEIHSRYKGIPNLPKAESLKQTKGRVLPFWEKEIAPRLKQGKAVLITAHGNSLRALIKHIEQINDKDITKLEIPTGTPIAYTLSQNSLKPGAERKILSQ